MKKKIEYESKYIMPEEIMDIIDIMEKRIIDDKYEPDKILCNTGNLRGALIGWFAKNYEDVEG